MRHLREADVKIDFFQDEEFEKFCKTLDSEMKRIRSIGDGTRKGQAEIITPEEEERLWTTGTYFIHWNILQCIIIIIKIKLLKISYILQCIYNKIIKNFLIN